MNTMIRVSTLLAACGLAAGAAAQDVRVTEILYNPLFQPDNSWEFVEIFNASDSDIDLTGWVIDDIGGDPVGAANIAGGTLPAGGTAVLYNGGDLTLADVEAAWGTGINFVAVDPWQALNNGGDQFGLWDSFAAHGGVRDFSAAVVDITYDDDGTVWPADDGVSSIYLTNPFYDDTDGTSYALSTAGKDGAVESAPAGTGPDVSVASPGVTPLDFAVQGPYLINISGATLFASFFEAPASTNDFLDPDFDGFARRIGPGVDQLAPAGQRTVPFDDDAHWIVTYRSTGSGNGFAEFVLTSDPDGPFGGGGFPFFDETRDDDDPQVGLFSEDAENALANRELFINEDTGPVAGVFNVANPGGSPFRSATDGSFLASTYTFPGTESAGGKRIDMGVLDVPSSWFVTIAGTGSFEANPGAVGYGDSGISSVEKDGTPSGQGQGLKDLGGLSLFDPTNPPAIDATDVIFDTPIAFVPIAPVVNYGVGLSEIDMSDLRYGNATGRRSNGENLVFVVRDSGSGTRNGFQNSIGLDPSWGRGENIGVKNNRAEFNILGPDFVPGNKGGSGSLEQTVINTRLAIGHTGAERLSRWLFSGQANMLAVRNDLQGGTEFSRAVIDEVLDNDANGYTIGGPESFTTIGSPKAVAPSLGGEAGSTLPPMANEQAAAYLNNITGSISVFEDDPTVPEAEFTPAEFLARNFTLTASTDFVQDLNDPLNLIANPDFNQSLQDFIRVNSDVLGDPRAQDFDFDEAGLVPTRTTGVTYTDGVVGGGNYVDQSGAPVLYASELSDRNKIAGDFDNDGERNLDDLDELVEALEDRAGFEPGSDLVLEIIGDFDGDGNFDADDARYAADGLAIDPTTGLLDRVAGFTAIDDASASGNFFMTTIGDGSIAYSSGDSRFDVSNAAGLTTPGWSPEAGADGVVDANDRAYIQAQIDAVGDGEANWDDIAEAVLFDLSADVTGDLVVNQDDLDAIDALLGTGCPVDLDGDGEATIFDFLEFQNLFDAGDLAADFDGDGELTIFDFLEFQNLFDAGCP
ncbi:MAG: lamin tail domain-containing protein [Planctomycetota bacterium]